MRGLIIHDLKLATFGWVMVLLFCLGGTIIVFYEFSINSYNGSVALMNVMTFIVTTSLAGMSIVIGDRYYKWHEYAFSTPAGVRGYVRAKYIVVLILLALEYTFFTVVYFIAKFKYDAVIDYFTLLAIMILGLLIISIVYPLTFAKNYKVLPIVVYMPILIAVGIFTSDVFEYGSEVSPSNYKLDITKYLSGIDIFVWIAAVPIIIGVVFLSYKVSLKNVQKYMKQ